MEEEIWKDIQGYEGLYKVSNCGNVWSCITKRILKPSKNTHTKHLGVILCKNSKKKRFQIHRLVAQAFIPNPLNLPQVNHINEIQDDNRSINLEWCSLKYNNRYSSYKLKGKIPWNKGKKGLYKLSDETKQKIREVHIGRKLTTQTKQKISDSLKLYYKNRGINI